MTLTMSLTLTIETGCKKKSVRRLIIVSKIIPQCLIETFNVQTLFAPHFFGRVRMSSLPPFDLEIYFSQYEFNTRYLLCSSDAESLKMTQLLEMAEGDAESMALWENLSLGYTESSGLPVLKSEIARTMYGGHLEAKNVLCFAGAEEGIYCVMRSLLRPRDHVIVVTPCYQSLLSVAAAVCTEGGVTEVPLLAAERWSSVSLPDKVRKAIRAERTKMVIINFPHNPTGSVIDKRTQEELIDLCEAHRLILFSDEVYRGLERVEEASSDPVAVAPYPQTLSLGVMSKSFGLAGLRIGWIACRDEALLQRVAEGKHYLSICNSAPSEVLALIALRNRDRIYERIRRIIATNLQCIEGFLSRHPETFRWNTPGGGCCGFMEFRGEGTVEALAHRLVTDHGVLILPGSCFPGGREEETSRHFRIGFGRENFPEALAQMEKALFTSKS